MDATVISVSGAENSSRQEWVLRHSGSLCRERWRRAGRAEQGMLVASLLLSQRDRGPGVSKDVPLSAWSSHTATIPRPPGHGHGQTGTNSMPRPRRKQRGRCNLSQATTTTTTSNPLTALARTPPQTPPRSPAAITPSGPSLPPCLRIDHAHQPPTNTTTAKKPHTGPSVRIPRAQSIRAPEPRKTARGSRPRPGPNELDPPDMTPRMRPETGRGGTSVPPKHV